MSSVLEWNKQACSLFESLCALCLDVPEIAQKHFQTLQSEQTFLDANIIYDAGVGYDDSWMGDYLPIKDEAVGDALQIHESSPSFSEDFLAESPGDS